MLRNPLAYGVGWEELTADPRLEGRRYHTPFFLHLKCVMQLRGIRVTKLGSMLRVCCCYTTFFLHLTMFDAAQRYQSHKARLNTENLLLLHHILSVPAMFDAVQRY